MEWRIPRLEEIYRKRQMTAEAALRSIKPGRRIFVGTACAEPQYLVRSLMQFARRMDDSELIHLVTVGGSPLADAKSKNMFRLNTFFIGSAAPREAVARGDADYTPMFLSEIPKVINSRRLRLDVALVQVSPPDAFGNCSLGVSVECVKAAVEHASYVVAQVNSKMPRTQGSSFVSVEDLDAIIEHDEPILEYESNEPDDVSDRIGFYVSRLVPNGATIQAGIGSIPNAVLRHLADKRDLGVHTEMFSDGLIDLYEQGVINNSKKSFHRGKIVSAFCMGTRRLYDFIDGNPAFDFRSTDHVSDPRQIARNDDMVAINSALQIDLTGQICSDSIGHRFYSGIGGQADFIRGAALARNGRPIIALKSTALDGTISRIVSVLSPGAGVVTTRGDVHYIVTEYGIAYLHGKSVRQRTLALINIAHPDFRAELLEEAKKLNYVYEDQQLPPTGGSMYPEHYRWEMTTLRGKALEFRPIKPIDEDAVRDLFYGMRDEDIYYRFMGAVKTMRHEKAQPLVMLDYEEKFAIAGVVGDESNEEFVAIARWFLDRATNMAEVAFLVHPEYQAQGIGTFMLHRLIDVAREKRIRGFTAEVLSGNRKMQHVFYRSGYNVRSKLEDGVHNISFTFDDPKEG